MSTSDSYDVLPLSRLTHKQLLRRALTSSDTALQALADTYIYTTFDFRPLAPAIQVLGDPPSTEASANEALNRRAFACVGVLRNVGSTAVSNVDAARQFATSIEGHWTSIFSWCQHLSDYAAKSLPPEASNRFLLDIGKFLGLFAMPPLSVMVLHMPDYLAPVQLAFRLWDSYHNSRRLADVSSGGLAGVSAFLASWLVQGGDLGQTVIDLLARSARTRVFFRSLNHRFAALHDRTRRQVLDPHSAEKFFVIYAGIMTSTIDLDRSMDVHLVDNKTFVALSHCLTKLTETRTRGQLLRSDGFVTFALTHLYEMIGWAGDTRWHFLTKLEQLAQGGCFCVIRTALANHAADSLQHDLACSLLIMMTPYLIYPRIFQAASRSLGGLLDFTIPQPSCWWDQFQECFRRSSLTLERGEQSFRYACDNLEVRMGHNLRKTCVDSKSKTEQHYVSRKGPPLTWRKTCSACKSVFYCSKSCQLEDWDRLHRSECKVFVAITGARKDQGRWVPFGSRGNLAATLLQIYCERRLEHIEDTRAFNNIEPENLVTTFDFRQSAKPVASFKTKAGFFAEIRLSEGQPGFKRIQAILSVASDADVRTVEAAFPHNEESIRLVARVQGTSQSGFHFLHGAWVTRSHSD
ncbi:hypothetical protein NMY22_g4545 [Coprinellus aureogranulatus]|nr:hypothetical protein NMY22_g4545 [Coprinellus aureogranulatus]